MEKGKWEVVEKSGTSTGWITEEIFSLIDIVKSSECIYNPRHENYFCRPFVENIWKKIDIKLGKSQGASLSKWTNLRISFRREYTNFLTEHTKPSWIFFNRMFFLRHFLRRKRRQPEGLETHIQEALEKMSSITRGNFKNSIENIEACEEEPTEAYKEGEEEDNPWDNSEHIKEESDPDDYVVETIDAENAESGEMDHAPSPHTYDEMLIPEERQITISSPNPNPSSTTTEATKLSKYDDNVITIRSELYDESPQPYDESPQPAILQVTNDVNFLKKLTTKENLNSICESNDAMFLLSLLPDIQQLSGKDKGRFKIEVQKLIQNLLYPEDN